MHVKEIQADIELILLASIVCIDSLMHLLLYLFFK